MKLKAILSANTPDRSGRLATCTLPQGMFQQRYVKRHMAFCGSQNQTAFRPLILGLDPTESWSFSSEKSYSPSRLICCQDRTEPFAMVWNRISRAFAAPSRCPALLLRRRCHGRYKGLTPHASRVNGTVPVATIPWRFTYLCWNIPSLLLVT